MIPASTALFGSAVITFFSTHKPIDIALLQQWVVTLNSISLRWVQAKFAGFAFFNATNAVFVHHRQVVEVRAAVHTSHFNHVVDLRLFTLLDAHVHHVVGFPLTLCVRRADLAGEAGCYRLRLLRV